MALPRVVLVLGKGGVGRSTISAAIAKACAQAGKKTLLYQVHGTDRIGGYYGRAPLGHEQVLLEPNLWACNPSPASALREYGLMILRFQRVYDLVFENRLSQGFLRAIPGLDEYALLGKAWFHSTETQNGRPRWDHVIVDMPASGHSLSLLGVPKAILQTVPDGPLTRDAKAILAMLTDPQQCASVLVTLAEEMPSREAIDLATQLDARLGIVARHLVVNQLYPDFEALAPTLPALLADPVTEPVAAHARFALLRRRINQEHLGLLAQSLALPTSLVSHRWVDALSQRELSDIGKELDKLTGFQGAASNSP